MNLKKKVIFGVVVGLFAVATVFNMSVLNESSAGDVSLDAVAVMAQADGEYHWGGSDGLCMHVRNNICVWDDGYWAYGIFV